MEDQYQGPWIPAEKRLWEHGMDIIKIIIYNKVYNPISEVSPLIVVASGNPWIM